MMRFDKKNEDKLKEILYTSCVHDAKFKNVEYSPKKDCIKIELINEFFEVEIKLIFENVRFSLAIKSEECLNFGTIISLTVEEGFSYLQNYCPRVSEFVKDSVYMLFQTFSGGELHIVSDNITVEIIK